VRPSRFVLVAATVAVLSAMSAGPALAVTDPEFVVAPAAGSDVHPDGGWYRLQGTPGEQAAQTLRLHNPGSNHVELHLAPVDAAAAAFGGVAYSLPDAPLAATGRWLQLDRSTVTLAPGQSIDVPFTVAVPSDARAGQHLAGIAVWPQQPSQVHAPGDAGQASAAIDVHTRRVVAVEVDLPGGRGADLTVTDVQPVARPDGLYLDIAVANTGDALTKATGAIALPDGRTTPLTIDTIVPETSFSYPVRWTDAADNGRYDISVTLDHDGGHTKWNGMFTLGEQVQTELVDRGATAATPTQRSIPTAPLLAVAGIAVAASIAAWRRRRRRGDTPRTPSGGSSWTSPLRQDTSDERMALCQRRRSEAVGSSPTSSSVTPPRWCWTPADRSPKSPASWACTSRRWAAGWRSCAPTAGRATS
jgi:hypothetical protein